MATKKKKVLLPTKEINWKEVWVRAAKTAVQTASAGYALDALIFGGDLKGLQLMLISAGAAFVSTVWNAAVAWANTP
jgi:hypothetical protein